MGVGKIFSIGGLKVMKFHVSLLKLKKQPFFAKKCTVYNRTISNIKIQVGPRPPLDPHCNAHGQSMLHASV